MNSRLPGTAAVRSLALLAAAAVVLAAGWSVAAPRERTNRRPARRRPTTLKIGQIAPDFELPTLTLEKNKEGELAGKITKEKIKLSSFRGQQSVVVFFSSYT